MTKEKCPSIEEIISPVIEQISGILTSIDLTLFDQISIPALSVILGAWLAHRSSIKTQQKNYQIQFQIKTYENLLSSMRRMTNISSKYGALFRNFSININMDYQAQLDNRPKIDWKNRPEKFLQMQSEYLSSISDLMIEIESVLIVDPRLDIFRLALAFVHHEVSENTYKITNDICNFTTKEIIDKNGQVIIIPPDIITLEKKEEINKIIYQATDVISDGTSFMEDFKVELQNALLGEVYPKNKVSHRVPIDPKAIVIKLDNYDCLKNYFENETSMGKKNKEIMDEVREQYKDAN